MFEESTSVITSTLFATATLDSVVGIRSYFPSDFILFGIAIYTYANHQTILPEIVLLVTGGSFVGNQLSYFGGRFIRKKTFVDNASSKFARWHNSARQLVEKNGAMAFCASQFLRPMRGMTAFVGGTCHIRYSTFLVWNLVGCLIWACLWSSILFLLAQTCRLFGII